MTDRRRAVRDAYDDVAETYAERRAADPLEDLEPLHDRLEAGDAVLDAGCGQGRPIAATLSERFRVTGLDVSREQLRLARAAVPDAALLQGDVTSLPLADGRFDAVCCLYTLIHVPDDRQDAAIGEFARVLRSGGWLLATVGEERGTGRNPDWLDSGVEMHWSFSGLERTREALAEAGFAVVEQRSVDDELGGSFPTLLARLE